jgi:hypothetical protein
MGRGNGQKNEGLDCTESATLLRDLQGPLGDDRRQTRRSGTKKRGDKIRSKKKKKRERNPNDQEGKWKGTQKWEKPRTVHGREPFRDCIIMAWTICPHGPHLDAQKKKERKEDSES